MFRLSCFRKIIHTALFVIGFFPVAVIACSCKEVTLEQQFSQAEFVFTARISRTEMTKENGSPSYIKGFFEVVEAFKGKPAPLKYVSSYFSDGECALPLQEGYTYMFFIKSDQRLNICAGSDRILLDHPRFSVVLNKLRILKQSVKSDSR